MTKPVLPAALAAAWLSITGLATLSPATSLAQSDYPAKAVQVVIPYAPGGTTDVEARLYAQKLGDALGKSFVLDFKPGAGSVFGSNLVAKAAPDGYTILMTTASIAVSPALVKDLPYDPAKDFASVSLMSKRATLLLMHPSNPFKTFPEYLAYAKANPGKINFGTSGAGGIIHLSGAWLSSLTNTQVTFVHYKGSGQMYTDLLAGRVHVTPVTFTTGLPYIRSGKLVPLVVTSAERSKLLDMPTVAEQGVPGYEYPSWFGVLAPAGTPAPIVNRLSAELAKIARSPEVVKKLAEADGSFMVGSTPEQFRQMIVTETARWKKLVQDTGIKLEE
jgi:tripartite-type tricarboxylate transporter receptor subunit TctC